MDPHEIFISENGLCAGWRLLIWILVFMSLSGAIAVAVMKLFHPQEGAFLDPRRLIFGDLVATFVPALASTWVMARIEHRTFQDYYVPARNSFVREFGRGIVWGFLAVSLPGVPDNFVGLCVAGDRARRGIHVSRMRANSRWAEC
jgi:hypothetical protein